LSVTARGGQSVGRVSDGFLPSGLSMAWASLPNPFVIPSIVPVLSHIMRVTMGIIAKPPERKVPDLAAWRND
jgi:hypothetical protein